VLFSVLSFDDTTKLSSRLTTISYGLAAAVWTRRRQENAQRFRRLKAGTVWINPYGLMDASACPLADTRVRFRTPRVWHAAIEHYTELKNRFG